MTPTTDQYERFLAHLRAEAANTKQESLILQRIAEEKRAKEVEAKEIAKVDKKLSEVEREYLEAIKAQEIMDEIDEDRKRDV